jgi:predicted deacetylase
LNDSVVLVLNTSFTASLICVSFEVVPDATIGAGFGTAFIISFCPFSFDDFHTIKKAAAEEEIRTGLEIFHEIGIKPNVFVPPAWKLNNSSIEVLQKLGFNLAETQEKFVLLSHNGFKKIKVPKVLNWDSTGYPEKNVVNIAKDERCFSLLIKQNPQNCPASTRST